MILVPVVDHFADKTVFERRGIENRRQLAVENHLVPTLIEFPPERFSLLYRFPLGLIVVVQRSLVDSILDSLIFKVKLVLFEREWRLLLIRIMRLFDCAFLKLHKGSPRVLKAW